jgi:hypothetical protein
MEKRKMRLSYEKVADVLYISFGKPSFGIDEESEPGIFIRRVFDQTFHFFKKWNVYELRPAIYYDDFIEYD